MDVTVLKVDLSDATFNAPFGGTAEGADEAEEAEAGAGFDEKAGRARGIAALVGLAFLVAGALLVERVLADSGRGDGGAEAAIEEEAIEIDT